MTAKLKEILDASDWTPPTEAQIAIWLLAYKQRGYTLPENILAFLQMYGGFVNKYRVKPRRSDVRIDPMDGLSRFHDGDVQILHTLFGSYVVPIGTSTDGDFVILMDEQNRMFGIMRADELYAWEGTPDGFLEYLATDEGYAKSEGHLMFVEEFDDFR